MHRTQHGHDGHAYDGPARAATLDRVAARSALCALWERSRERLPAAPPSESVPPCRA